jgi:hypothetical protein
MRGRVWLVVGLLLTLGMGADPGEKRLVRLTGEILDSATAQPLPARVYVHGTDGSWHFPRSVAPDGSAVPYRRQRPGNPLSVEMHSTLSAHPFAVDLPPGKYTITVERGHEYHPEVREVTIGKGPVRQTFKLRRWIDLARRGWYSGETHVHRSLDELPTLMLAEDLNVAFPLTYWVTQAFTPPRQGTKGAIKDPGPKPIAVDATHVIYPRNTEYEIFTVGKKGHTLGAFFVINHKRVFEQGVPPVQPIGKLAHDEGALIDLDKPNWPWSMLLVALLKVDLYELANNHVWRTEFGFPTFGEKPPDFMKVERDARGLTERGWIDFTLQTYYTLLNCGFRLRPTAGTASGVHPVPLGFGRVYVHLEKGFSYDAWVQGLNAGRSFVTTGPMLFVEVDGRPPGHTFKQQGQAARKYRVTGSAVSAQPLQRVEVLVNGEVAQTIKPQNRRTDSGAHESVIKAEVTVEGSSWVAVRCFEDRKDGRVRFAHSGPVHIDVTGRPLRPRRAEIEFLVRRAEEELARSRDVLPEAALAEYREALRIYREIAKTAR